MLCAFMSTHVAPCPGGEDQEKQGPGLRCGYQHAGAPGFPGRDVMVVLVAAASLPAGEDSKGKGQRSATES